MKAWLVSMPGEPVPGVDEGQRLLRMGLLAERLLREGHEVTWWSSSFDHVHKQLRGDGDLRMTPREGLEVRLLNAGSYLRNVCWARMRHNARLGVAFRRAAAGVARPDVIYAALPAPEVCLAAVDHGRIHDVPVVVDVRDLWPDAIAELFPWPVRWAAFAGLWSMRRQVRGACSGARVLTAMSGGCLQWGQEQARRARGDRDRVFHLAYPGEVPGKPEQEAARKFWSRLGVDGGQHRIVCFIGTLGVSVRLGEVIECARRCASDSPSFQFVFGGEGPQLEHYKTMSADCPNIIWPGWLDEPKIFTLMAQAWVGLVPYASSFNMERGMPNKVGEYLSQGLPILSSLRGSVAELLEQHGVGLTFRGRDVEDFMAKLDRLAGEPGLHKGMAANGRRLFQEQFDAERVYGEFAGLLEDLGGAQA